jgi:hypothetical protein
MANTEFGFQQTPQPDVYAVETKFPTPDQMVANHDRLLVMLSGQRNKDGSPSNTPEFLAGFFGYSVDRVNSLIAEAANPIVCQPKELKAAEPLTVIPSTIPAELPTPEIIVESPAVAAEKKEKELIPGERAYFMGMAKGKYPGKRGSRFERDNVTVRCDSENEDVRKYLADTYGSYAETTATSNRVEFFLPSPKFDFLIDPNPTDAMLQNPWRLAPFLLGVMHSKGIDKDGRLCHPDEALLRRIQTFFSLCFDRSIGDVRQDNRNGKRRSPFIKIKDVEGVYDTLYRIDSVQQIPFVKNLPGYRERK